MELISGLFFNYRKTKTFPLFGQSKFVLPYVGKKHFMKGTCKFHYNYELGSPCFLANRKVIFCFPFDSEVFIKLFTRYRGKNCLWNMHCNEEIFASLILLWNTTFVDSRATLEYWGILLRHLYLRKEVLKMFLHVESLDIDIPEGWVFNASFFLSLFSSLWVFAFLVFW